MAKFEKGVPRPANAGRKKGSENKLNADIKAMILGAVNRVGGEAYFARQAEENPGPFMALVGKILPKELEVTGAAGSPLIPVEPDRTKLALGILTELREVFAAREGGKSE